MTDLNQAFFDGRRAHALKRLEKTLAAIFGVFRPHKVPANRDAFDGQIVYDLSHMCVLQLPGLVDEFYRCNSQVRHILFTKVVRIVARGFSCISKIELIQSKLVVDLVADPDELSAGVDILGGELENVFLAISGIEYENSGEQEIFLSALKEVTHPIQLETIDRQTKAISIAREQIVKELLCAMYSVK